MDGLGRKEESPVHYHPYGTTEVAVNVLFLLVLLNCGFRFTYLK